jgi:hypothetical protein
MINNIKLGYSIIGQKIYLYRHGKDAGLALERREAEADVMKVITEKMMDGCPKGSVLNYTIGEQSFRMVIEPVSKEAGEK